MKVLRIKYLWTLLLLAGLVACDGHDYSIPDNSVPLDPGTADFTRYVAVGNSLTSGYTDGALFQAGQMNSYPYILSQKFQIVGGGEFSQPLTNDNIGGLLLGGNQIARPRLYFDGKLPAVLPATPTTEVSDIKPGPYNNMGVPGARVYHLVYNGYGNISGLANGTANPYFVRMASSPNASVLEDAMAQDPTFFTLWIGNNDVLGYAISGGSGRSKITDENIFASAYKAIAGGLVSNGAKGVILNIPNVTAIPYFTTVPYNPLDPKDDSFGPMVPVLNKFYEPLNMAFDYLGVPERKVTFSNVNNSPMVIHDESLTDLSAQLFKVMVAGGLDPVTAGLMSQQFGQSRPATDEDLFTLRSAGEIGEVNEDYFNYLVSLGVPQDKAGQLSINGITYPMLDKWVLLPSEQLEIKQAIGKFNQIIKETADNYDLAFVDANAFMEELSTTGIMSNGFLLTSKLVTGGAFSLDGVHLTARGYSLVANFILESIDRKYGSNFKEAGALNNVGDYPIFYSPDMK